MKKLTLLLLSIAFSCNIFAQQAAIFNTNDLAVYNAVKSSKDSMYNFTFVYPDGKRGAVIKNGKTATIANRANNYCYQFRWYTFVVDR
jgi:hypothetical protein